MFFADYHIHTSFSSDSTSEMPKMIEKAIDLGLSCTGMEFATEIIGKFAMSGAVIKEIPADLRCDGRNGRSHLRSIRDGFRHLFLMMKH